ncbi:hypothetical protein SacazDRAFT_04376 [Saccharomonospora azurea NA-128]|uniref:Uncharacterized protein n=2 Tax=Saccharomonospora azurea TaxID=40988 RepID=H8G537_9PSEU|nr:hypothetical protein SacazDRAFT_04376 [Saccharomonospora azurea NA-128]
MNSAEEPSSGIGNVFSAAQAAFGSQSSMNPEAMAAAERSANNLVESAKSGGFRVTKEAADPLIKVLEDFVNQIKEMDSTFRAFEAAPPLGDHDYGQLVSRRMQEAAAVGPGSALEVIRQLEIILKKSAEALLRASNQYEEQEESVKDTLRGLGE